MIHEEEKTPVLFHNQNGTVEDDDHQQSEDSNSLMSADDNPSYKNTTTDRALLIKEKVAVAGTNEVPSPHMPELAVDSENLASPPAYEENSSDSIREI